MPVYVVAMMSVHDAVAYRKHTDLTPPLIEKYGDDS